MNIMEKLKRTLKRSRMRRKHRDEHGDDDKFFLPTRDDFQPIDTSEQEEIVRSLEIVQAKQSMLWRSLFGAILFCYVGFLLYTIYQQLFYPWELRFHSYFMDEIDSWKIIAAEWTAILVCLMAIAGIMHTSKHHRLCHWLSCFPGVLLSIFWLHHMLRLPKFRWDILWLPLGPLSGAGVSLYVDIVLDESTAEIRKLRGYMYAYKAS